MGMQGMILGVMIAGSAVMLASAHADVAPEKVIMRVQNDGTVYVGSKRYTDEAALEKALTELARHNPQPDIHIKSDPVIRFEVIGHVILLMQKCGLHSKVGFITAPRGR
jgi:biopolymer transport protein ExbD